MAACSGTRVVDVELWEHRWYVKVCTRANGKAGCVNVDMTDLMLEEVEAEARRIVEARCEDDKDCVVENWSFFMWDAEERLAETALPMIVAGENEEQLVERACKRMGGK